MTTQHCCGEMAAHLSKGEVAVIYIDQFREYGIEYREDYGGGLQQILFCPWCGTRLPRNLRHEWFAILDELQLEPESAAVPAEMRSDAWWRRRGF